MERRKNERFYNTSECAKQLGVHINTLRAWDKKGLFCPEYKTLGGQRRYTQRQIDDIKRQMHDDADF